MTFLPSCTEHLCATESHVISVTLRIPGGICHKLSSLRDDSSAGSQSLMALNGCPGKGKSAVGLPCPAGLGVCAWGGCTGSRHLQLGHLHICMCHDSRSVGAHVVKNVQYRGTGRFGICTGPDALACRRHAHGAQAIIDDSRNADVHCHDPSPA